MASPPAGPPPLGGDQDRAPEFLILFWIGLSATLVFVVLRLCSRLMIGNLWWDDYAMFLTEVLLVVTTIMATVLAHQGGFRHVYYLHPDRISPSIRLNWMTQPFAIMGLALGKISVALLILRIMGQSFYRRWFLRTIIALTFGINAIGCILTFAQCAPPRALWTPSITAHCWNPSVQTDYAIFSAGWNATVDFVLALLPITIFWNLKMSLRKRISLCLLLGTSILAAISAAIKASKLSGLSARGDFTWATFELYVWTGVELYAIIICGCLPTLKPLFQGGLLKRRQTNQGSYSTKPVSCSGAYSAPSCEVALMEWPSTGVVSTRVFGNDQRDGFSPVDSKLSLRNDIHVRKTIGISADFDPRTFEEGHPGGRTKTSDLAHCDGIV